MNRVLLMCQNDLHQTQTGFPSATVLHFNFETLQPNCYKPGGSMLLNKIKSPLKIMALVCVLAIFLLFTIELNSTSAHKPRNCEKYTRYFNGGVHHIGGVDYRLELCGISGNVGKSGIESILISIYLAESSDLLAQRVFRVNWHSPLTDVEIIQYTETGFVYYDADWNGGADTELKSVDLPVSAWSNFKEKFF